MGFLGVLSRVGIEQSGAIECKKGLGFDHKLLTAF
jgi:hypothetical protein